MEHRRSVRKHLFQYLEVTDAETSAHLGNLVDITTEGLMLMGENSYTTGSEWKMILDLPEEIEGQAQLRFKAKCAWSRPSVNARFFDSGFSLIDCDQPTRDVITLLIRFFAFRK